MTAKKSYIIEKLQEPEELGENYVASLTVLEGSEDNLTDGIPDVILKRRDMTKEEAEEVLSRSHVLKVYVDEEVFADGSEDLENPQAKMEEAALEASSSSSSSAEISSIARFHGFDRTHAWGWRGQGRVIAILDTGIDDAWADSLGARLLHAKTLVMGEDHKDTVSGHGTHVLGIVAMLAMEAKLISMKVLSTKNGAGMMSTIILGINESMKLGATDINLSLGGNGNSSSPVSRAATAARRSGVQVNCAAGNGQLGKSTMTADGHAPGSSIETRTWASITIGRVLSSFSSWGNCVDFCAVGDRVVSWGLKRTQNTMSGTSQACPVGTAAGAVCASMGASATEVDRVLAMNAGRLDYPSYKVGRGILDVEFAVRTLRREFKKEKLGKGVA